MLAVRFWHFAGRYRGTLASLARLVLGTASNENDYCTVEYYSSEKCKTMNFGPITSNGHIGGVILKPHVLMREFKNFSVNYRRKYTVLNITFSNIKWKTMKFRFEEARQNHCRNIVLSNEASFNDQSVLYYDCYWPESLESAGQSQILDFEASDDNVVNRGRYYFNVPSVQMLNPINELDWKPFVYLEILSDKIRLHVMAPPEQVNITSFNIKVMHEIKGVNCDEIVTNKTLSFKNHTDEVTFDYSLLGSPGSYYFVVMPLHDNCKGSVPCQTAESPRFTVSNNATTVNVCIASISALIVATLFAYYIVLRVLRRYWCRDYRLAMGHEIPAPTKVLVIYSPANRLHAECVTSFVNYLRAEFGFEIMYDGDISYTSDQDPYVWAVEAFKLATHVMYIVGPNEINNQYNNIYEKPIVSAHRNLDTLQLSLLKANRGTRNQKHIINVVFEHSNGPIPLETKHDKVFYLLKEWNKLIAYLSKNLLPKKQMVRTEKGRCLLEDLTKAKKLLNSSNFHV
ncbi:hypothetical protein MSG28_010066 [Choristoneura fumiferana]|uniref:Uncharacterized protein n=1 Tax=Choristoneura fumiferana TaxID=7141 RepID=A0ACC0KJT2_CHOFU|nr:hypothetical protein MSG28_010066 [Choristoneura fumiferana]